MFYEVALSPSGKLRCVSYEEAASAAAALPDKLIKPIVKALSADVAKALFLLAACPQENGLSPSFVFWRQLACIYLTERCHTTVSTDTELEAIEPLPALADLLKGAPPMPGAEYLSLAVLQHYWCLLDHWLCEQVKQQGKGLTAFLSLHAKQWHAAGKVCFHLVENKKDPAYPFAFMATYAAQDSTRHQALGKALQEYAGAANKKALINLLSPVHLASKSSTLIAELVASGDIYHPLAWTPQQAYEFMQDVPLYEDCGVVVRLPDWWKKRARPQVGVRLETAAKNTLGASSLLNFRVELALGEQTLSEQEWQDLMDADDGLLLLKGQWVEVDREQLAQALAHWQSVEKQQGQDGMSFVEGMRLLAGASADLSTQSRVQDSPQWSFVRADKNLSQILQQLREPESLPATVAGKSLLATLRPYQEVGLNWLWRLSQLGLGACLADDMGLGKTLQIIALLLKYKRKRDVKPSLLVLPASLLGNWQQEMDKFAPSLRYLFVHPAMNDKTTWQAMSQGELPTAIDKLDVVLTTYGMLSRQDWLMEQDWQLVVLDEAQAIKNPGSRQSKAVKQLKAQARIALTGPPGA
ncbi:MAG: DEAD/DEAH box helicase family protein, partial [Pseudomonadales bacterium]|nr:DEAD/DEAH box helicase family protein [Pseudomonadales bacterium]